MLTLTFHGHACFTLEADGRRVIIDPFLTGNPATDIPLARLPKIDAVLLSHGHGDHLGDAIPIARRDGATIIATAELARFCGERSEEHTSELQSLAYLVCRLLLEKKKKSKKISSDKK